MTPLTLEAQARGLVTVHHVGGEPPYYWLVRIGCHTVGWWAQEHEAEEHAGFLRDPILAFAQQAVARQQKEIDRLTEESEMWEKASLVKLMQERDALRVRIKELEAIHGTSDK